MDGGWRLAARWAQLHGGFAVLAVAICLMLRSGLGLGPWDAFHYGVHLMTGITVGVASIVVGAVVLTGTMLAGFRPGLGTLLNMVLIGVFVDLLLPWVPPADHWTVGLPYFLVGIALSGFGAGMYIAAGLGNGPRDGLMLAISQRTRIPVRRVRTALEASVLCLGWLMGAKIGVGTVLFTLGAGYAAQWGLQLFRYSATGEPPSARGVPEVESLPTAA